MPEKMRVSAVSYTNAKPFVYGLKQLNDQIDLSLDIPSDCADKLINNQIDIGLVPVATLLSLNHYQIVSDYCIGALGAVNSVFIFSEKPISEIKTIRADQQSRTSNLLARVLLKNHWKINPNWVETAEAEAFVQIGDRTFGKADQYAYAYDLSACWFEMTALPFVFAAWVSNKPVSDEFISQFNEALAFGLKHRSILINELDTFPNFDMAKYLNEYIRYDWDDAKKTALAHFLELATTV